MRPSPVLFVLAALPLSACDMHSNPETRGGNDVHISIARDDGGSGRMAVTVPGLDAKLSLPNFMMGDGHMDIDGMKLAPDTTIRTVDVVGKDKPEGKDDDGTVHMTFSNPKGRSDLMAYYRKAAADAGFRVGAVSGDSGMLATKGEKKFALSLADDGRGSTGRIDISGHD